MRALSRSICASSSAMRLRWCLSAAYARLRASASRRFCSLLFGALDRGAVS